MSAAANEVYVLKALKLVLRAKIEHLIHGVRQVEGGTDKDVFVFPPFWGDAAFFDDVLLKVLHACVLDDAIEYLISVGLVIFLPWVVVAGVDGGNEDVNLGVSGRCHGGVSDT